MIHFHLATPISRYGVYKQYNYPSIIGNITQTPPILFPPISTNIPSATLGRVFEPMMNISSSSTIPKSFADLPVWNIATIISNAGEQYQEVSGELSHVKGIAKQSETSQRDETGVSVHIENNIENTSTTLSHLVQAESCPSYIQVERVLPKGVLLKRSLEMSDRQTTYNFNTTNQKRRKRKRKLCEYENCVKVAQGKTPFCLSHGGGYRCKQQNCTSGARGKSGFCISHGGGKLCLSDNCTTAARGHSNYCINHGGGKRCQFPNCTKSAQGTTRMCKRHGNGRQCRYSRFRVTVKDM